MNDKFCEWLKSQGIPDSRMPSIINAVNAMHKAYCYCDNSNQKRMRDIGWNELLRRFCLYDPVSLYIDLNNPNAKRPKVCERCGTDEGVDTYPNPYQKEMNDEESLEDLCVDCYKNIQGDI